MARLVRHRQPNGPATDILNLNHRATSRLYLLLVLLPSDNGGRTAAVLFTMTASCKRHGIDPFRYLTDVLRRLPTTARDGLTELLPDVWFQTHPQAARKRAA